VGKPRKLWATAYARVIPDKRRHETKAAAYRYVENEVRNWLCNALRSQHLTVYVDERDGRGFQVYEHVDLDELSKAGDS
jgi:hypothetical protein